MKQRVQPIDADLSLLPQLPLFPIRVTQKLKLLSFGFSALLRATAHGTDRYKRYNTMPYVLL